MALKSIPRKVNVPVPTKLRAVQVPARPAPQGYSAEDGFARARSLNETRQRDFDLRKLRPIEFGMKIGEGGSKGVTLIITDNVRYPTMPYFQYCHRWGFEQNDPKTEVCIQDDPEGCGLCRQLNRKGGYEMVLSCVDTRPYTYSRGPNQGKTVPRSRKPLIIKTGMIPVYERLWKAHKTFRGMVVTVHRDGGKNSPASGSSVNYVRHLTEAELSKYGDLGKPLNYKEAYPRLTPAKMNEMYNINAGGVIGSEDVASGAHSDDVPF